MAQRKPVNYITNDEIYPSLAEYVKEYRAAKAQGLPPEQFPRVPEKVGAAILLIAKNLSKKGNFSGYSFVSDMIGDGYENCIRYIHNFDPDKSRNPFAYITLIIHRAFVRRIEKESQHAYTKHKMVLSVSDVFDMMEEEGAGDIPSVGSVNLAKSSEIVQKYEDKQQAKKEKKRQKDEDRLNNGHPLRS